MRNNNDIRAAAESLDSGDDPYIPLPVVCKLLNIPSPEGITQNAGAFLLQGGTLGQTHSEKWARAEISARQGEDQDICRWIFHLCGIIRFRNQFEIWLQSLREEIWPWSNVAMDDKAKVALRDFRWKNPYPANPGLMVPLPYRVGPPYESLVMDPSPMRQERSLNQPT
mgnify:FL=1